MLIGEKDKGLDKDKEKLNKYCKTIEINKQKKRKLNNNKYKIFKII
jgi:hypothetical protein